MMQTAVRAQPAGTKREADAARVCCIIPAYRCGSAVARVVAGALEYAHDVVVVDDACPDGSAEAVRAQFGSCERVHLIRLEKNGGVGVAMKAGIRRALDLHADVIVKIDGDGQMDASYVPAMVDVLLGDPDVCLVKGNRFGGDQVLQKMPPVRLLGNSVLSLLIRFASGYWDMLDPTNGFIAFNAHALEAIGWEKFADRFFFESSVLCAAGLRREKIAEVQMPALYGGEKSSLSVLRSAAEFPPKLLLGLLRRIFLQYFVFDINIASLYLIAGTLLCLAGLGFGGYEWREALVTGIARTPGTVMLAVMPLLMGFQLLLNSLLYDVQFSRKIFRQPAVWDRRRRKRYVRP